MSRGVNGWYKSRDQITFHSVSTLKETLSEGVIREFTRMIGQELDLDAELYLSSDRSIMYFSYKNRFDIVVKMVISEGT
jgi:hypothetical protein